jgi:hypothetical protein
MLVKTQDGYALAEADLSLRGPGEMWGMRQSGLPRLKLARLFRDHELLDRAHVAARRVVGGDPHLLLPAHAPLRKAPEATEALDVARGLGGERRPATRRPRGRLPPRPRSATMTRSFEYGQPEHGRPTMTVHCPHCGTGYLLPDHLLGLAPQVRCQCRRPFGTARGGVGRGGRAATPAVGTWNPPGAADPRRAPPGEAARRPRRRWRAARARRFARAGDAEPWRPRSSRLWPAGSTRESDGRARARRSGAGGAGAGADAGLRRVPRPRRSGRATPRRSARAADLGRDLL